MITVADIIAQTLREAGVETVYGLPGGEVVAILDALRRHGLRFVLVRNESSAVFMAAAQARLSGKPGACLTTLGPGAANAVAGLAHAYLDRAPVLIITGQLPSELWSYHTHQLIDLQALYRPITKATVALQPVGAAETVAAALALTTTGRPGPVHLQVSKDLAGAVVQPGPPALDRPTAPPQDGIDAASLDQARQLLARSRRPVIVAGLGLEPQRPYAELRHLAEAVQAPVIVTPKAKGALADDHPLSAGTIGLTRTDPVYSILDEADCILALSFDVVELVKPWNQPAPLIWLAPWQNSDPPLPAAVEVVGQLAPTLAALVSEPTDPDPAWGAARVAAFRTELARDELPEPPAGRLYPQQVFRTVRRLLPRNGMVAVDVGSHKILGSLIWPAYVPNRFALSNGLSSMGFALPATIAAAMTLGNQPVVCFSGDAGLSMVAGELSLLADLEHALIVVVFNDAALDLIRSHQVRAGHPVFGTEFPATDFVALAAAYGLPARRVTNEAECVEAVRSALASGRPALIEAMIDPATYPTTPGRSGPT